MHWLLILTFASGPEASQRPVGLMINREACIIAGAGMAAVLERANPGLSVHFTCLPEVTV